jgi:hypothetical protein
LASGLPVRATSVLMLAILLPQANDSKHNNAFRNLGDIYTGDCKI